MLKKIEKEKEIYRILFKVWETQILLDTLEEKLLILLQSERQKKVEFTNINKKNHEN